MAQASTRYRENETKCYVYTIWEMSDKHVQRCFYETPTNLMAVAVIITDFKHNIYKLHSRFS